MLDILHRVNYLLVSAIFLLKKFDEKNVIIITGEPRSGTTWLQGILTTQKGIIGLFEPLHVVRGVVPDDYNFGWRPYIPEENNDTMYIEFFSKLFRGEILNQWMISSVPLFAISKIVSSQRILIKFVRGNMLLPWWVHHFNFTTKPIVIIRHPVPVAISQLMNFHQDSVDRKFIIPQCINNSLYVQHYAYLSTLESSLEVQVALWCMQNVYILSNSKPDKWIVVYYEILCNDTVSELKRISDLSNLPLDGYKLSTISKPSRTAFNSKDALEMHMHLNGWIEDFQDDQLNRLQKVLDYFKVTTYNCHQVMPILE